jgi:type II secretory pathway component PulJ
MRAGFGERGFTLGELLLVMSLGTFAVTGVKSFVSHTRGDNEEKRRQEDLYRELTTQGRGAVDRMVQEVTLAGTPAPDATPMDPAVDPAGSDPAVTAANSNRIAARQLLVATPTQIIFEADLDRDGAVERVEYRLNGEVLERSAVAKNPDGTAPTAQYQTVIENVDNGAMPLFTYPTDPFAASGAGQSPSVRVLLLLRAPEGKSKKQPYRTVGFEGVASLQPLPRTEPVEQSTVENPADAPAVLVPGIASNEPVRAIYSIKWTMR